jgi:hypothetical protein
MHSYLKFTVLLLTLLFAMTCCLLPSPTTPVVESTPTGAVALQSPIPSPNPAPLMPSDTPAPTSLNATGPYIMFEGASGTWVTNPDGSFPTRVSEYELQVWRQGDLHRAISPKGDRMVLVIQNDQGLDLVMVTIPGGETETIAHLLSITRDEDTSDLTNPKGFAYLAITTYENYAWQPGDGRLLAFVGAVNGPTSDLYLYDTRTKETTQLTDGPSQAIFPNWSPDGQYILNFGVSWVPPFGGAIGYANQMDGVWAVQVSDEKVITLPKPKDAFPHFIGWQDDSHYITFDSDEECESTNLRSVDVVSGETTPIMDYSFYNYIAQSPENGALLFSSAPGCPNSLGEGTFLLLPGQTTPSMLLDKRTWEIDWIPESRVFDAYPEALFSSDGNTRYDPPVYDKSFYHAISNNGYQAWEVSENNQGRVVVKEPGGEWQTVFTGNARSLIWDPIDGNTLLIALDDGSLYAASVPDFTPREMGTLGGSIDQAVWLP